MTTNQLLGPFCQSCAMPLDKPEDFGTNEVGYRVNDYCHYCYVKGAFTTPDITLGQMTDLCVDAMVRRSVMPEAKARALMMEVLPKLKRWRIRATAAHV
jgi:putative zinc ribbon protein